MLLLLFIVLLTGCASFRQASQTRGAGKKALTNQPHSVVWNPLEKQRWDPDTLYLLDAATGQQWKPGNGSVPAGQEAHASWKKVIPAAGKYRTGFKCLNRDAGYLVMPAAGLLDHHEFTVEFWLKCNQQWADVFKNWPLVLGDGTGALKLNARVHGGWLTLQCWRLNNPGEPVYYRINYDVLNNPLPAHEWINLACTFDGKNLCLYVRGKLVGQDEGLKSVQPGDRGTLGDGLNVYLRKSLRVPRPLAAGVNERDLGRLDADSNLRPLGCCWLE